LIAVILLCVTLFPATCFLADASKPASDSQADSQAQRITKLEETLKSYQETSSEIFSATQENYNRNILVVGTIATLGVTVLAVFLGFQLWTSRGIVKEIMKNISDVDTKREKNFNVLESNVLRQFGRTMHLMGHYNVAIVWLFRSLEKSLAAETVDLAHADIMNDIQETINQLKNAVVKQVPRKVFTEMLSIIKSVKDKKVLSNETVEAWENFIQDLPKI